MENINEINEQAALELKNKCIVETIWNTFSGLSESETIRKAYIAGTEASLAFLNKKFADSLLRGEDKKLLQGIHMTICMYEVLRRKVEEAKDLDDFFNNYIGSRKQFEDVAEEIIKTLK